MTDTVQHVGLFRNGRNRALRIPRGIRVGGAICTSIIVAAELRYGVEESGSRQLSERLELILSAFEIMPLESPADRHYGELRHRLARQGTPIGPNDH